MTETEAQNTGRLWDNSGAQMGPTPDAVWRGNMAFESHRANEYLKRWARGLYTDAYNARQKLNAATAKLKVA
ncbi:MAG: hypothetical protein IT436_05205 [Phycisphaerales bacterium]|nr:hypothetical protein [Phycisphaerales bacterium]